MKKKKIIIIVLSILTLILGISILGIKLYQNPKDIKVNKIELLEPLKNSDSSLSAKQVINNVVKIINKLDDKNTIYGTGFFDKSGYLVTNSHIVDIKGEITVLYQDGTTSEAILVSNDILSDLAILSVENVRAKALPFESTINLEVTDEVYSIGYQLNLEGDASVTKGILSAKRVVSGIEFLQTDAAVNSGGSGGPVIDDKGNLLGITTLATDNATLSFSISSDTLDLYITKLIHNMNVTYIKEKRPNNALSNVLKEVNYLETDIYDEGKYLKQENKLEDDEKDTQDNHKHHHNGNINNESNVSPEPVYINITPKSPSPVLVNGNLSNNVNDYFTLESELTNCTLDLSKVDITKVGTYSVGVTCKENSGETNITIYGTVEPNHIDIPNIQMDETKNNVTSLNQIKGTWYYPGYRDTCSIFREVRGTYEWFALSYNPYKGKLFYNYGGAAVYDSEQALLDTAKFWVSGDYLVITTDEAQYTLTRKKGIGVYDERYYFDNFCER